MRGLPGASGDTSRCAPEHAAKLHKTHARSRERRIEDEFRRPGGFGERSVFIRGDGGAGAGLAGRCPQVMTVDRAPDER